MSYEYVRDLDTEELCDWIRDQPGLVGDKLNSIVCVIRQQQIEGSNLINLARQDWIDVGLTLGAADSIVQITRRIMQNIELKEDVEMNKLCQGFGSSWAYQYPKGIHDKLRHHVTNHFLNWKKGKYDKSLHPLFLCFSAPGSGKSRFLDEFRNILVDCIPASDKECYEYIQNSKGFPVSFENGTQKLTGNPEFEIGGRMLFQLAKMELDWSSFIARNHAKVTIGNVLEKLPKDLKCVILLVDGMQELQHESQSKESYFYKVMQSISEVVCSYKSKFVIAVCAATVFLPFNEFVSSSAQLRCYISLPRLNASSIFSKEQLDDPLKKVIIREMGGHGRALEICKQVLDEYSTETWTFLTEKVVHNLSELYGTKLKTLSTSNWKYVLRAVLLRKTFYNESSKVWNSSDAWTVEDVVSAGLFSFDEIAKTLEVAPVFLQLIEDSEIKKWRLSYSELTFFLSPQEPSGTLAWWQNWEILNVHFRCLKSLVFDGEDVSFASLHAGAEFPIDSRLFERNVIMQKIFYSQKSRRCLTDSDNCRVSDLSKMYPSASGSESGDAFVCFKADEYHFHEVHQYKHKKAKFRLNDLKKEVEKGASPSDIFICFATSDCDIQKQDIPPNCALVHRKNWKQYYGPFWATIFHLYDRLVLINFASEEELARVDKIGKIRAALIIEEREKRKFTGYADAETRLKKFPKAVLRDAFSYAVNLFE